MMDILGFCKFYSVIGDGTLRYGVRGMGRQYEEFYEWAKTRIEVTSMDWPWLFFKITDPIDQMVFEESYASIMDDQTERTD